MKKILVAFYSYSGNTKKIAEKIQKQANADIFEIKTVNAYPAEYNEAVNQAKTEIAEGFKPGIRNHVNNIEVYDTVFIGTPNWWSTIAPPILTFLSANNWADKTIAPFITHGGGGEAGCSVDIKKNAPGARVLKAAAFYGAEGDTEKWVKNILRLTGV